MPEKRITAPCERSELSLLRAGDSVLITGEIYSARDAAHKKLIGLINSGKNLPFPDGALAETALPFPIKNSFIYHMGPSPAAPGKIIGSAGPTTSGRMDPYSPVLLKLGLGAIIGKGKLSPETKKAIAENGAVYFAAIGGAGALLRSRIISAEAVAWPELGAEAVMRLKVRDFPAVVAVDSLGGDIYELGPKEYLRSKNQ